jgi:hypothetical protein
MATFSFADKVNRFKKEVTDKIDMPEEAMIVLVSAFLEVAKFDRVETKTVTITTLSFADKVKLFKKEVTDKITMPEEAMVVLVDAFLKVVKFDNMATTYLVRPKRSIKHSKITKNK